MTSKHHNSISRRLHRWIIKRDHGICWICGQPGADTADHIKPWHTHPHLRFDPTNLKAAHGKAHPEYGCPGQMSRGNNPPPTVTHNHWTTP